MTAVIRDWVSMLLLALLFVCLAPVGVLYALVHSRPVKWFLLGMLVTWLLTLLGSGSPRCPPPIGAGAAAGSMIAFAGGGFHFSAHCGAKDTAKRLECGYSLPRSEKGPIDE